MLTEARRDQQPKEKRVQCWAATVELAEYRKDPRTALTQAEKEGDAVELRLARARLLIAEKPDGLVAKIDALGNDAQPPFSVEDQARPLRRPG